MSEVRADDERGSPPIVLVPIVLVGLALGLRFAGTAAKGLWIDEAYSVHLARLGIRPLIQSLALELTPPAYYLLLHGWIGLFGDSEFAVRFLSVLFGGATIGVLWSVARRGFSPRLAAIACALLVVSPIHVYYCQEARMYSLLALLAVCLAGTGLAWLRTRARAALAGFAATSLLLLLTHNVALWLVAGFSIALLAFAADRSTARELVFAQGLALVAWLPWLAVLLRQVSGQAIVLDWFAPLWASKNAFFHVADTLWCFGFGPYPVYLMLGPSLGEGWPVRLALVGLSLAGAARAWVEPALRVVLGGSALTILFAVAYSLLAQPVYIPGRTDLYLVPLFALTLAAGFEWMRPRAAAWAGVAAYGALALAVLVPFYQDSSKHESLRFLQAVRAQARPGDWVVTTGRTFAETEYYLRRLGVGARLESFPAAAREHPGYLSWDEMLADPAALAAGAASLAGAADAALGADGRLFLILIVNPANNPLLTELERRFTLESESGDLYRQSVTGVAVHLLVWKRPPEGRPAS